MNFTPQKVTRGVIRRFNNWLNSDVAADEINEERNRFHNFAYSDLNCRMLRIMNEVGSIVRPNYTWAVLHSAYLAKSLGIPRISVIEFGVAGGNGLVALEEVATQVEAALGVGIDVIGFDTGEGLPRVLDYRDMPNIYTAGTYKMDVDSLKKRLKRSKLVLGNVADTLQDFLATRPAPIGFISVDVDLYTSTVDALKVLDADQSLLLPRVHCYFDDIMGCSCAEFLGERLAMNEFNETHAKSKISPIFGLSHYVPKRYASDIWVHMIYMAHLLDHPLYCNDDGMVTRKSEDLVKRVESPQATAPAMAAMVGAPS